MYQHSDRLFTMRNFSEFFFTFAYWVLGDACSKSPIKKENDIRNILIELY